MTSEFNLAGWYRNLCAEGGGMKLNQKPSTLWETMRLDDEWKARLEAAVLDEREACARVCRDLGRGHGVAFAEFDCVEAIRARGQE